MKEPKCHCFQGTMNNRMYARKVSYDDPDAERIYHEESVEILKRDICPGIDVSEHFRFWKWWRQKEAKNGRS